ncbi:MAG: amidohydrolase family protein [Bacteroides sp.]|nr:amidohydrolase family protein [Bacteroides sp.]
MDLDVENWFAKGLNNSLQLRVYFQTMDVQKDKRRKLCRIGGCFNAALDNYPRQNHRHTSIHTCLPTDEGIQICAEYGIALAIQHALKMCTYNTCWMSFDEKERGSLEARKIADMVILSESPYETDVAKLNTLKAEQLLLQGEPYQNIAQNPVGQVLRGILRRQER